MLKFTVQNKQVNSCTKQNKKLKGRETSRSMKYQKYNFKLCLLTSLLVCISFYSSG